jgi:CheY-like chemotaxis protein
MASAGEDSSLSETKIEKRLPEEPNMNVARTLDHNQPRILVVDDEEAVRELLRDLLESEGFRVHLAPDGREALSLFEANQFDGIFTDVGMPGMSGWELAHAIRQRNETIPIAVITGWGSAVGSDEQKEARVDWVITKPFRAERISELAEEICKRRDILIKRSAFAIVAA